MNQNIKMQHNLIQQITAMNSSGVPEELLRDINIMFKHFDKDGSGYLRGCFGFMVDLVVKEVGYSWVLAAVKD